MSAINDSSGAGDSDDFNRHFEALAQVLKDMIWEEFMTFDGTVVVDGHWKPPVQLQLNKQTRLQAKWEYFDNPRVFLFTSSLENHNQDPEKMPKLIVKWVKATDNISIDGKHVCFGIRGAAGTPIDAEEGRSIVDAIFSRLSQGLHLTTCAFELQYVLYEKWIWADYLWLADELPLRWVSGTAIGGVGQPLK